MSSCSSSCVVPFWLYQTKDSFRREMHRLFCTEYPKYKGWDPVREDEEDSPETASDPEVSVPPPVRRSRLFCGFCKQNGDRNSFYTTHMLKDPVTNDVVCPVLREHVCELCGETGKKAHTRSYCPVHPGQGNMVALKKTARNAHSWRNGRA